MRACFAMNMSSPFYAGCLALVLAGCAQAEPPSDETSPSPRPPPEPPAAADGGCPSEADLGAELPVWDLYVSEENWDLLHEDVKADVEVGAHLCVGGARYRIALELQGSSTRRLKKKSFDLKFEAGAPLRTDGFGEAEALPRVLLKAMFADQSLVREAIAFEMWRRMGHDAPRVSFANLRVNGAYWGLYELVEPIDGDYLARNAALYPAGGRLFKAVRENGSRADFAPGRDLKKAFENKTDDAYDDLAALVDALQHTPLSAAAYDAIIDPIFPLATYVDRMVWVSLTANGDAVAQNFFLYDAPRDGHDFWYLLPWDSNIAFGADWSDANGVLPLGAAMYIDGGNYFGRRLVQVDEMRDRYVARYRAVMDEVLTERVVLGIARGYTELVAHDLRLDQERWKRRVEPAAAFESIETFLRTRPGYADEALERLDAAHRVPSEERADVDDGSDEDADRGVEEGA
jgi:spore coat protein H